MSECLFCKIVSRTIPAALVYEDDVVVAFDDINPQAPTHTLVIPRKHVASMAGLQDSDVGLLGRLMLVGNTIAKQKGIADAG
ncbi:MAG: HIT domain-containing protein, partial [Nitrospirae bacterium]